MHKLSNELAPYMRTSIQYSPTQVFRLCNEVEIGHPGGGGGGGGGRGTNTIIKFADSYCWHGMHHVSTLKNVP